MSVGNAKRNRIANAHKDLSKSIDNDEYTALDENVISVVRANDLSDSSNSNSNNNNSNDDGIDDDADAKIKLINHNDCSESQRLLMHLDDIDGNDVIENNTASRTKSNPINSIIGPNDFELMKTTNSKHTPNNDNNNENNCSNSSSSGISNNCSINSRNSNRKHDNHQSGHNVIEFDAPIISPTNPFRIDYQEYELHSAQTKPNNCANEKNRNVVEASKTISLYAQFNDIQYQRNAKSLGYLDECSCSSGISCKCMRRMENLWIMRRTKSSTGIIKSPDNGNGTNDTVTSTLIAYRTTAADTIANNQINNRPFGDAYNGRFRSIFGITNRQHSMNMDSQRGRIKEFVQQRWQSLRLLSQQKLQQMSKQRKPVKPLGTASVGNRNSSNMNLQGITIEQSIDGGEFDVNGMGQRANSGTHLLEKMSAQAKRMDEYRPLMMATTTSHQQLKPSEYLLANNVEQMQQNNQPNNEHDFMSNAIPTNTNPFLAQSIDKGVEGIGKITGENHIDAKRCTPFRTSNEPEETISNQLITNDDNGATLIEPCSTNDFNKFDDNEQNIFGEMNTSPHRMHSHRTTAKQRASKKSNNLLMADSGDDTNQWNALTMPNRCATLMKYGSKRHSHKDHRTNSRGQQRQHNQSSDNLTLVDDTTGYQYIVKEASPRKIVTNEMRQQLIADETTTNRTRVYSAYAKNERRYTGSIGDIPTCPFQRQDYTNPNNDDSAHQRQQKKSKKDLLLNFAMQKGKCLSSSIGRNQPTEHFKATHQIGHLPKAKYISSDCVAGIATATSMNHMSNESLFVPKLHANRLAIRQRHRAHYRDKDDKTYLDKTKKGLLKIGQKCGLKLNGGLSSSSGGNSDGNGNGCGSSTTMTKYERSSLREPLSEQLSADAAHAAHTNSTNMAKFPYKSYRSEIDLTKNLHYLDEFLNENFDKSTVADETMGKYKMEVISNERHRHKHRNVLGNDDGHSKRNHRHRTRSVSKVSDFDASHKSAMHASNGDERGSGRANDSPESNYNGIDALLSSSALQMQRAYTSTGGYSSNIKDNLNSIMGQQQQHHHHHPHQQNQYAISTSSTIEASNTFASYKHLPPPPPPPLPQPSPATQKFAIERDGMAASGSSGEKCTTKSHTTSSSLSSSDYASVYSPCSQLNETNGKFIASSSVNLMQMAEVTPSASDHDAHGIGAAAGCGNHDLILKQKRYPSNSGAYHKRNGTAMNTELPAYNIRPTYYSDARPLNRIDGLRLNDDDDDDVDILEQIINPQENAVDDCDATNYMRANNDKLSSYQYENQLSYHEDYLQHYYSKNRQPIASTSTHGQTLISPMASHSTQIHVSGYGGVGPAPFNRSASISSNYATPITIRQQSNYPQSRVVISKQKNGRSHANDVVLEYEC